MNNFKRQICIIFSLFILLNLSSAQSLIISDNNLKKCLIEDNKINTNKDTEIDSTEARISKVVNCLGAGISDLTGLQEFRNIKELKISVRDISFINLNFADSLEVAFIDDLTSNSNSGLSSIDLKSNTKLLFLRLANSNISSIDLSANHKIEALLVENSKLSGTLDLSNNRKLYYLKCTNSILNKIIFSDSSKKHLTDLNIKSNYFDTIDLGELKGLLRLNCNYNQLKSLNLIGSSNLENLLCSNNSILSLSLNNLKKLQELNCDSNELNVLDISSNSKLTNLKARHNKLTYLNLKNGNNEFLNINVQENHSLKCILVEDVVWSESKWRDWVDSTARFSKTCDVSNPKECGEEFKVFPNPSSGNIHITGLLEISTILVCNQLGQEFCRYEQIIEDLDINLACGIYFIKVSDAKNQRTIKVIVL